MEPHRETDRPLNLLGHRSPLVVLLVFLAVLAAATAAYWSKTIPYPYGLEHGEGYVIDLALQVAQGRSPYHTLDDYPLTIGNYPPLSYWLNGAVISQVGLTFSAGRLLSAAAALAAALLMALLVTRQTDEPLAGALAALFYLSLPTVRSSASLARVDILAGALAFGGLVAALRLRGRPGLWTAAALFALALATKHSTVAAPAAVCVGLIAVEPRRGLTLAGLTGGLTLAWVGLGVALYGPVMLLNLGPYTTTPLEASRLVDYLIHLPATYLPGLAALVVATLWAFRRGSPEGAVSVLYGWCSVATLALLAKHGSSFLYLSEFSIALSLALGLAAGWGLKAVSKMRPPWATAAVALGCLALLGLRTPPPANPVAQPLKEAKALWLHDLSAQRSEDEAMVELLRGVDGPLLAESADLALAAGKEVLATPFALKWLAQAGIWDESMIVDDLARGRFAAVQLNSFASDPSPRPLSPAEEIRAALTRGRFSPAILEAIDRHYRPSHDLPRGVLYEPRPKENAPGAR